MLLNIEGFEGAPSLAGGASAALRDLLQSKGYYVYAADIWSDAGRVTGTSFKDHANRGFAIPFKTTDDTVIIGFGYKTTNWSAASVGNYICRLSDHLGNVHASIQMYNANEWRIVVPEGTYYTSNNSGGDLSTWYYIEFKIKIDNTTGSFELRINGVNELSVSGIDTQANSDGAVSIANFQSVVIWRWYDDIYICDSTSAANNDFLGECQIVGIFPNGDGSSSDFTPQGAALNHDTVDEASIDDDATYNYGGSGDIDYYTFSDIATDLNVLGLQINTTVRSTDAESFAISSKIKSGASVDTGIARYLNVEYTTEYEVVVIDPDTAVAWTPVGVNAAEFGLEIA